MRGPRQVLSHVVATQHHLHEDFAGVVPEIASRAHLERIVPVVREALSQADVGFNDLDAVAVGHRPGLIGSLLVGVSAAKALAWSLGKPLIGVDHVISHLIAAELDDAPLECPALGLVVSGGHSSIYLVHRPLEIDRIGRTIDDALGEAFDKAAAILDLGYPGGPAIDKLAQRGDDRTHDFPVAHLAADSLDFSFSGLKTALLYAVRGRPTTRGESAVFDRDASDLNDPEKADLAASFQRAAVRAVTKKITRALEQHPGVKCLVIGGGVSANTRLRAEMAALAKQHKLPLRLPQMQYCLDNAAMIAGLAAHRFAARQFDDLTLSASTSSAIT